MTIKKRILVVDDNMMQLKTLTHHLKGRYEVFTATNGAEAIQRIEETGNNHFDAILSDYRMPDMNGGDLIRICRMIPGYHNKPMLIISGESATFLQAIANQVGADGFFTKPVLPGPLVRCLEYHFDHYENLIGLAGFPEEF